MIDVTHIQQAASSTSVDVVSIPVGYVALAVDSIEKSNTDDT